MDNPQESADGARPAPTARTRMIDVAEQLIASRGIGGVSLREVGAAAGQRNNSAAQYHFGSKDGLVEAVISTRSAPVEQARAAMIEAVGDDASVRQLVEIFVLPLAALLHTPTHYLRFLRQVMIGQGSDVLTFEARTGLRQAGMRHLHAGLRRHVPHLDRARFTRRLTWLAQITLQVLAEHEQASAQHGAPLVDDLPSVVEDLLVTLEAMLTAPA